MKYCLKTILPVIFVNHGAGPMHLHGGHDDAIKSHLLHVGSKFAEEETKPKAILVISAHHESEPFLMVSSDLVPSEYPDEQYLSPTDINLSKRVQNLLVENEIPCEFDPNHVLDHGSVTPLLIGFPKHDIPVVSLSIHKSMDPQKHLNIGKALQPLREEGVLIMGSGMSFHNLSSLFSKKLVNGPTLGYEFDQKLTKIITSPDPVLRNEALKDWEKFPDARKVHPHEDHLMPLLVITGAAGSDIGTQTDSFVFMGASVSGYSFP